jgi:hypothetical protein
MRCNGEEALKRALNLARHGTMFVFEETGFWIELS